MMPRLKALAGQALAAVRPTPSKPRRRPGESWTDEHGVRWTYWPAEREPERGDYFAPGGARRALKRWARGRWNAAERGKVG